MQVKDSIALTDPGGRPANEDAVLAHPTSRVFAVADGMGGPGAGDAASVAAVEEILKYAPELARAVDAASDLTSSRERTALAGRLEAVFERIHAAVAQRAKQKAGMATTCVIALVSRERLYVGHVGDSRAYLFRAGELRPITEDHSVAALKYRQGRMSAEEYQSSPLRQRLFQVLGAAVEIDVDVAEAPLADDDLLLLATDGLTDALTDPQIAAILARGGDLAGLAKELVRQAKAVRSDDNISVVLARLGADADADSVDGAEGARRASFLFQGLNRAEQMLVAPWLDERALADGDVLYREGEQGNVLYVLLRGRLAVTRNGQKVRDLGPGEWAGQLPFGRSTTRHFTVTATAPTRVMALYRDQFEELMQRRPAIGARVALGMMVRVQERLEETQARLADTEAARGRLPASS